MRKRLFAGPLLISLLFYTCYGLMFPTALQGFVDGLMLLLQNGHLFLLGSPIVIAFTAILTRKNGKNPRNSCSYDLNENIFDLIRQAAKEVAESHQKK